MTRDESDVGSSADAGHLQPEAAEVESARLLANQARDPLRADRIPDEVIRRMADEFIASGNDGDVELFVRRVREQWTGSLASAESTKP